MTLPIQLIVGLGNPGQSYEDTRHNAGAWFIEALLKETAIQLKSEPKFKGLVGHGKLGSHDCYILLPTTYMNLSGESVLAFAHFHKILPEAILVAHDELALPAGTVRLKQGGGHAGHNGLRDIIARLGSSDFMRLRIGIGHPGHKDDVTQYVLSRAKKEEQIEIEHAIDRACQVTPDLLSGNLQKAIADLHTSESKD